MRATGHGISAGIGKFGAFIGVFLFPLLQTSLGLHGTLLLTAAVSVLGFALTLVLPETSGVSLEDIATPSGNSLDETGIYTRFTGAPPPLTAAASGRSGISGLRIIFLDVDLHDSAAHDAACALISVIDGAFAAVSSRNATARPKISPRVWPASSA